ncbi:MAG: hypothetical protein WBV82_01815 [Myxococcaceae bacterium]
MVATLAVVPTVAAVVIAIVIAVAPIILLAPVVIPVVVPFAILMPLPVGRVPRRVDVLRGVVPPPAAILAGVILHEPVRHVAMLDPNPAASVVVRPVPVVAPAYPVPAIHHVEILVVVLDDVDIGVDDDQGRGHLEADVGYIDGNVNLRHGERRQHQREHGQNGSHRVLPKG